MSQSTPAGASRYVDDRLGELVGVPRAFGVIVDNFHSPSAGLTIELVITLVRYNREPLGNALNHCTELLAVHVGEDR
jgi:hypothetical protein